MPPTNPPNPGQAENLNECQLSGRWGPSGVCDWISVTAFPQNGFLKMDFLGQSVFTAGSDI